MVTSVQITEELQQELVKRKISDRETYEEIIWDLLEDTLEINEQTKKEIAISRQEIKTGKIHTLVKIKEKIGL